jgi:ASC-1-like (ASCH) protein
MKYVEHVSEPWFSLILLGLKTVEGRLKKGRFGEMKEGDVIEWNNDDFGNRSVTTIISKICYYPSFHSYLTSEKLTNCLPSISTIKDGVNVYYKYYTPENEEKYGIVAIHIKILDIMARSELIYMSKKLNLPYSNKRKEELISILKR